MAFTANYKDRMQAITDLFKTTFTASEGAKEGALIGGLVEQIFATTEAADIFVFCAFEDDALTGSAIFTRMRYPSDPRCVFILSPMAVAPHHQGVGLGQKLLTYGLNGLRQNGVDVALTYGDINFYSKLGFMQISQTIAQPPLPLTYPSGWLGQSLTSKPLDPLQGASRCVEALSDPAFW